MKVYLGLANTNYANRVNNRILKTQNTDMRPKLSSDIFENKDKTLQNVSFKATFWKHVKYSTTAGAAAGATAGATMGGVIDLGSLGSTLGVPTVTGKIGGGVVGGGIGFLTGTITYFVSKDIEKRKQEAELAAAKLEKEIKEIEDKNKALAEQQAIADRKNQEAIEKQQAKLDEQKKQIEILKKYAVKTINETSGVGMGKIAGYSDDKELLNEAFISPYRKSFEQNLQETGEVIPNGILLYGISGNGKTTLAYGLIQELQHCTNTQVYDLSDIKRSQLDEKLEEIKVKAKSDFENENKRTIIFLDEFDGFAPNMSIIKRKLMGGTVENPSNGYLKNFMNNCADYGITIIATTNYPRNMEKPFLDNDRRFSVRTAIEPPNAENIKAILEYYLDGLTDESVNIQEVTDVLSQKIDTDNAMYSGGKIEKIAEKAKETAKKEKRLVSQEDLLKIANKTKPNLDSGDISEFKDDFEFITNMTYEEYLQEKEKMKEIQEEE